MQLARVLSLLIKTCS